MVRTHGEESCARVPAAVNGETLGGGLAADLLRISGLAALAHQPGPFGSTCFQEKTDANSFLDVRA